MDYTYGSHLYLSIVGVILLIVVVFTLRSEVTFLAQNRSLRFQFVLSLLSLFVLILVTMTCLFHWFIRPEFTFIVIMALLPVLLILAPLILYLRAKSFAKLSKVRYEEQRQLIREVQEMIDEKKRQKIKEGKISRGEELDRDWKSDDGNQQS
jgi:hypothetical protein